MRPAGAPLLDWSERRDWLTGIHETGGYEPLVRHFAREIAAVAQRFAQEPDVLLIVSPSLGGDALLAAASLLRAAGLAPRIACDRRFWQPEADGPELDEYRRDRVLAFRQRLERSGEAVELVESVAPAALLIDASFTPLVPFGTPWRHLPEWGDAWRGLVGAAMVSIAIDNLPFANPNGAGMYVFEDHPSYTVTLALGALAEQHVMLSTAPRCGSILLAPAEPPVPDRWRVAGRPRLAPPAPHAHKYSRGMVVVVSGEMAGAARLAARAATAAGAGYVLLVGEETDAGLDAIVQRRVTDADGLANLLSDSRIGAVVIGPGLGRSDEARDWLNAAIASDRPLVIDADALMLLGTDNDSVFHRKPHTWLTPHHGEWAALTGESTLEYGKLARTAWLAEEGCGIIFKGADSVIGTPEGAAVLDRLAPSWLSTAGTGDVLAGVLAARLAVRQGHWSCGAEAAWLHMRAAQFAGAAFSADALIHHLPRAIEECL